MKVAAVGLLSLGIVLGTMCGQAFASRSISQNIRVSIAPAVPLVAGAPASVQEFASSALAGGVNTRYVKAETVSVGDTQAFYYTLAEKL